MANKNRDEYELAFKSITMSKLKVPTLEDPKLNVPKVMSSRELELFKKEAKLIGWKVRKHSRRSMSVEGEGQTAIYRRNRRVWVRQGVYPFRSAAILISAYGDGHLSSPQGVSQVSKPPDFPKVLGDWRDATLYLKEMRLSGARISKGATWACIYLDEWEARYITERSVWVLAYWGPYDVEDGLIFMGKGDRLVTWECGTWIDTETGEPIEP